MKIARKVERQAGSKVGRWKTGFGSGRWEGRKTEVGETGGGGLRRPFI